MNVLPGQDVLLELEAGNEMIIGSIDLLLAPEGDNQDDDCFVMTWGIEDGEDNEKWNNDCRDYIVANANSDADYEMTIYIVFGMRECRWY